MTLSINNIRSWCTASHCHVLTRCRRLAHTRNPFPYPSHRNPTPHQIFHLPHSATEAEIKARYYDLVRLYHPDKLVSCAISPDEAHERFQAITIAYDKLRGKTLGYCDDATSSKQKQHQTTAAYRAMQRKRQEELYNTGAVDDSMMDKLLITGVVATIFFVVIHNLTTRREAIAGAMLRSKAIAAEAHDRRTQVVERRLSLEGERVDNKRSP